MAEKRSARARRQTHWRQKTGPGRARSPPLRGAVLRERRRWQEGPSWSPLQNFASARKCQRRPQIEPAAAIPSKDFVTLRGLQTRLKAGGDGGEGSGDLA